jgi:hypothetical protein
MLHDRRQANLMAARSDRPERHGGTSVLAFGTAAFAVLCCAGLPLVVSLVGGLTLVGVLGVGAGLLIAAAAVATTVVVVRARRPPPPRDTSGSATETRP